MSAEVYVEDPNAVWRVYSARLLVKIYWLMKTLASGEASRGD